MSALTRGYLRTASALSAGYGVFGVVVAFMTTPHPWQYAWIIPAAFALLGWVTVTLLWFKEFRPRGGAR